MTAINIPNGWNSKYERNEVQFCVYDQYEITLSLKHHLVTCNACTRLWRALEPDRKTFRASWWLCPEGCNK
jgi:hypothetical protein